MSKTFCFEGTFLRPFWHKLQRGLSYFFFEVVSWTLGLMQIIERAEKNEAGSVTPWGGLPFPVMGAGKQG